MKFVHELAPLTVNANTDSVVSLQSQLQQFFAAQSFSDRFDLYKMNKVKFTFIPRITNTVAVADGQGWIFTILNQNGSMLPIPSVQQALNNSRARRHPYLKPFSIYYKPAIADLIATDVGLTVTHAQPKYNQWLSTLTRDVTHYGADVLISNPSAAIATWDVLETIYISFKQRNGA